MAGFSTLARDWGAGFGAGRQGRGRRDFRAGEARLGDVLMSVR